ncbi:MAG: SCO family protein [Porticoccus sp.]
MKPLSRLLILLTFLLGTTVVAEEIAMQQHQHKPAPTFDRKTALDTSQSAIGNQLNEYHFFTGQGQPKKLSEYRGKPLVISLIYTSCFHICPTTTKHLDKVMSKARSVLGEDSFNIVTIGFDSDNDTADAMRFFAKQQSVNEDNWDFLSTDKETILQFSKQLGFQFFPSPNGFDHLVQTTLLDEHGVVNRQVYGIQFETPHLVEPLKQLVFGEKADQSLFQQITDKVRLFCTVYDPYSDSYKFDYSIFVGLFIGLTIGGLMIILFIREWRYTHAARNK